MSLILEIEFLAGVCRAARQPADDAPEWPPQPDRIFSALVSSWATRGERDEDRVALEWLESQAEPPVIHASAHTERTTNDVYVPVNDAKPSKAPKTYEKIFPDRRPRQPRRFPVARPDNPVMTLVWKGEPGTERLKALNAIAGDVGYVGHSMSLARLRFSRSDAVTAARIGAPAPAQRRIYPGRLSELERAHRARPARPDISPGASVGAEIRRGSEFRDERGDDWLVLEAVCGIAPDIRAAALVCRLLRQTLMSGYRRIGLETAIPEALSGHAPDRTPTANPHIAIAPLAFSGFRHADGRVLGFALIPPGGTKLLEIPHFRRAFEEIAPFDRETQRRTVTLSGAPLHERLRLAPVNPADGAQRRSLSPVPYLQPSCRWASVTPVVLDRHPKRGDDRETRELVARACKNAGLPSPDPDRIQTGTHSAIEGAPSARPPAGAPPWMRWRAPKPYASRPLVHAVIDFEREVQGPVLLGAGRFTGLGLCRNPEC